MKTTWIPLSLRFARASLRPALLTLPLFALTGVLHAQEGPRITFPQPGQDVRGEISARFEGLPTGGYAVIKVGRDPKVLNFKTATAQGNFPLDTIADTSTFNGDGPYTLQVTALNASGRVVGTSSVTFNVANQKVAAASEATRLVHWTPSDRFYDGVQRYRVFAESNADITEPAAGGGAGGGGEGGGLSSGGGSGGGASGGSDSIPAPLDWQVSVLLRRQVRDVNGFERSANIATLVAEALQHQREGEGGGGGGAEGGASSGGGRSSGGGAGKSGGGPAVKAPWATTWSQGPEFAKFYVKAIQQTGDEINATRKANSIAIADLLPTFPTVPVRPGSTWNSRQSILSDLSTRKPINIEGAITFTAYDTIQTPAGVSRRCAKIESRFPLPDSVAKRIAADLGSKVGSAGGGGGGGGGAALGGGGGGRSMGGGGGDAGGGAATLTADDIKVAQFNMARVLWFDLDKHQVVRSEDNLRAYFELPPAQTGEGGAGGGGAMSLGGRGGGGEGEGGGPAAPPEPTKVNYSMTVTTVLDDRIPPPTLTHTGGIGTAHARDNATEPGLERATRR